VIKKKPIILASVSVSCFDLLAMNAGMHTFSNVKAQAVTDEIKDKTKTFLNLIGFIIHCQNVFIVDEVLFHFRPKACPKFKDL
jgi:hypothetical protein